jgi:polysaccharide biosynthesis/export protein
MKPISYHLAHIETGRAPRSGRKTSKNPRATGSILGTIMDPEQKETGSSDTAGKTAGVFCLGGGLVLWLTLILIAGAGCESTPPASYNNNLVSVPLAPGDADYANNPLREGDVVNITFQYSTSYNTVQKIPLDGDLNLESVGVVKAAGKTPIELQKVLADLYRPEIKDDVVTVKLVSAVSSIYVSGAVFHPGKLDMERPLTALEAVMEAGGFDPNRAKLSDVSVVRIENGKQHTYHVNLARALRGKDENPFYLRPFDIVHVPSKTFNF